MNRILSGLIVSATLTGTAHAAGLTLLNVSYDPTRELHAALGKAFAANYKTLDGKTVEIKASHGGTAISALTAAIKGRALATP
jgi:ABC-type sulfate transport system substrate-binding protein